MKNNRSYHARLNSRILGIAALGALALFVNVSVASAQCAGANLLHGGNLPTVPAKMLATPPSAQVAPSGTASPSITGLWQLNFYSEGQVVDVAFDVWHSDGTEILNDYTNPINGNVCLGAWKQTGTWTYKLTHPSWYFDNSGNLLGTEMLLETVTLAPNGNKFGGSYALEIFDTQGNLLVTYTGSLSATRINP